MSIASVVFWISLSLLLYAYLGYPALVYLWAHVGARPLRPGQVEPDVSLLIVAHNEASRIEGRLENVLSLAYPRDHLEVVLASDGSTDRTVERARKYAPGVTIVAFQTRRGKPAVLNEIIPKALGEIVVLADARQQFEPQALRALVAHFADPTVGAVSGELILARPDHASAVGSGVGWYWRYEKFIRRSESRVDSTVGATGAIYAIRRDLFDPIPDDTILDDVLIPLRVMRRGFRVLFEPAACAHDHGTASANEELARKARTLAGNFQLFARERWLLSPLRNRLWIQTLSHKVLRLFTPLLQATTLATNLLLVADPTYGLMLSAQVLFYAAALGGSAAPNANRKSPIMTLSYTICLLSWATMLGFLRFVTGRQPVTWEKPAS